MIQHRKRRHTLAGRHSVRQASGFSLTELLVVMGIIAIIGALAAPSFNRSILENRNLTATNSLIGSMNLARTEAIRRANTVTVCPSANGTSCGTDWAQGWIVFADNASTGTPQVGTVIQTNQVTRDTTFTRTVGANNWVRFTSRGGAELAVTFEIRPSTCTTGNYYRQVRVLASGRPQSERLSCS